MVQFLSIVGTATVVPSVLTTVAYAQMPVQIPLAVLSPAGGRVGQTVSVSPTLRTSMILQEIDL